VEWWVEGPLAQYWLIDDTSITQRSSVRGITDAREYRVPRRSWICSKGREECRDPSTSALIGFANQCLRGVTFLLDC
jgi:hypothetical protein